MIGSATTSTLVLQVQVEDAQTSLTTASAVCASRSRGRFTGGRGCSPGDPLLCRDWENRHAYQRRLYLAPHRPLARRTGFKAGCRGHQRPQCRQSAQVKVGVVPRPGTTELAV